jgi:hypothetical protein
MKKIFRFTAILATGVILLSGCAKTGPEGPAGAPGANGYNGNANVIGTINVVLNSSNWVAQGNGWYTTITAPAITQPVVDNGAVIVYEQNGIGWNALPYTYGIISRIYQFQLNTVYVTWANTDNSVTTNPGNQTYRIVAITASGLKQHPNVDLNNYEAVKAAYGLKEK